MKAPGSKVISRWALGLAFASILLGCSRKSGPLKVPVRGVVTLDGKPVPQGQIILSDAAGVSSSCGGEIKEGKFLLESTIGKKKVSVSSMQIVLGKKGRYGGIQGDPVSEQNPADVYEEVVPAKYNAQTELLVEITEAGPNEFPLSLTTKSTRQ